MKTSRPSILLLGLLLFAAPVFSQTESITYYVTANINSYQPIQSDKLFYSNLWYDKDASPGVLIGGFAAGFTAIKSFRDKVKLKGHGTLSRFRYWDAPVTFYSDNNDPLGIIIPAATDYVLGLGATAHYYLSENFSLGSGLGAHVLIASVSYIPDVILADPIVTVNRYYKVIMPVVPVEMVLTLKSTFISLRYEHALLNRSKSGLADYKTDRYGVIVAEIGFKL